MKIVENVHVAIVEDDKYLRDSIKDLLETAGYTSELYESADAFVKCGQYRSVKCILADVRMPGMTGIEMLQVMKAKDDCPPVFIMSSYADGQMESTALKLGATGFLPKPIDTDLLLRSIHDAIGGGIE